MFTFVIFVLAFSCACAIDINPSSANDVIEIDRRVLEPTSVDLNFANDGLHRRDSFYDPETGRTWKERSIELYAPTADGSLHHQLARRYDELVKRAVDVSGLKIPLIGDYFRFLRIPTFGEYYNSLNLPYISWLNIGREPETTTKLDIGPVSCTCQTTVCDCCYPQFNACANIQTINNETIGAKVSVKALGFQLFDTPISLINRPSFCLKLFDLFKSPVELCLELYNINTLIVKNNFCVTIGLQKGGKREINFNIGCIGIGFDKLFSYKLPPNLSFVNIPILGFK